MKKILILFLLTFPLLIFAIVSWSSSVIAYYVPISVERISITKGADIEADTLNRSYELEFEFYPKRASNQSFEVYDEEGNVLLQYNHKLKETKIKEDQDSAVVKVTTFNQKTVNEGKIHLKVETLNYGFSQISVITEEGGYEAHSDIYVADPDASQDTIQGVVFQYKNIHNDYVFGASNQVEVNYTYFPKRARIGIEGEEQINESLKKHALEIDFDIDNDAVIETNQLVEGTFGQGQLTVQLSPGANVLETKGLIKNSTYRFNASIGYNVYDESELIKNSACTDSACDEQRQVFLLREIFLTQWLSLKNIVLQGNHFRLNHTKLPYYNQKDKKGRLENVGKYAITITGNSEIENVHILGPLNELQQPYENIINLGLIGDRMISIKNSIIQNGRFNLTLIGKANMDLAQEDRPTKFLIKGLTLIGASFASIEVDNKAELGNRVVSTDVTIEQVKLSYTAIGLLLQNSNNAVKAADPKDDKPLGRSIVRLNYTQEQLSLDSSSWRNLDDASGALNQNNMGYILAELKSYTDVIYKDHKDYYVNPLIMIRGGTTNYSEVIFNDTVLYNMVILKKRTPNLIESLHPSIGGSYPFKIYLLDPAYYKEDMML